MTDIRDNGGIKDASWNTGSHGPNELVDTGVELPDGAGDKDDIDPLTRDEVEEDPGEATRKLPKNDQAL